jgi:hypothetical protein
VRVPLNTFDATAKEEDLGATVLQHFDERAQELGALIFAPAAKCFVVRPLWVLSSGHRSGGILLQVAA